MISMKSRMRENCTYGSVRGGSSVIVLWKLSTRPLDCLQYIRQLKDKNIAVFFEKENIKNGELVIVPEEAEVVR